MLCEARFLFFWTADYFFVILIVILVVILASSYICTFRAHSDRFHHPGIILISGHQAFLGSSVYYKTLEDLQAYCKGCPYSMPCCLTSSKSFAVSVNGERWKHCISAMGQHHPHVHPT